MESESESTSPAQIDAMPHWRRHRRRSVRWWWFYMVLAVGVGVEFAINFSSGDVSAEAVFVVIVFLALRGAWRSDRQIRECDRAMRSGRG